MGALIHYRCSATEHQHSTADPRSPTSPVSFYDGKWAYCPLGFHEGHSWAAIEPVSIDDIRQQGLRSEVRAPGTPV
jgi:hypothetical protein